MVAKKFRRGLEALTSLGDPVRRRLYETVAAEGRELSRDELARLTGLARPLVAYHLDRLVKSGLLTVRFERRNGRSGPGAGRPAKLYSRPRAPIQVAVPPRDYEVVAKVLLEAVARQPAGSMTSTLEEVAREAGREAARAGADGVSDEVEANSERLLCLLRERGYEPSSNAEGEVYLRNCVFDPLTEQDRELVCGMNLSLIQGLLEGLPDIGLSARLQPAEGRCCVILAPAGTAETGSTGNGR